MSKKWIMPVVGIILLSGVVSSCQKCFGGDEKEPIPTRSHSVTEEVEDQAPYKTTTKVTTAVTTSTSTATKIFTTTEATTISVATTEAAKTEPPVQEERVQEYVPPVAKTYIANTSTLKFHYSSCNSVDDMDESNKYYYEGSRDGLIAQGYIPCKKCNP